MVPSLIRACAELRRDLLNRPRDQPLILFGALSAGSDRPRGQAEKMTATYDTIGEGYIATRTADPRITERLVTLLDLPPGTTILDVGAGTGNYSHALAEAGYLVTALEPATVMREQGREHPRLSWLGGVAETLPFESGSFDGLIMTLCLHHFTNWRAALKEAARVAGHGPIVILSFDAEFDSGFWLFDYFPGFLEQNKGWQPKITDLGGFVAKDLSMQLEIHRFALPPDLVDHFAGAGWARPEIYLSETYRAGISAFSSLSAAETDSGSRALAKDLRSGAWDARHGELRNQQSLDLGYLFLKLGTG